MNKSELISAMAAEGGLSKADSKRALDAFIASVTKALKAGDKVWLWHFFCNGESRTHWHQSGNKETYSD